MKEAVSYRLPTYYDDEDVDSRSNSFPQLAAWKIPTEIKNGTTFANEFLFLVGRNNSEIQFLKEKLSPLQG